MNEVKNKVSSDQIGKESMLDSVKISFRVNDFKGIKFIYYTFGFIDSSFGKCNLISKCLKVIEIGGLMYIETGERNQEIRNNWIEVSFPALEAKLQHVNYARVNISDYKGEYSNELHLSNYKGLEKIKCN